MYVSHHGVPKEVIQGMLHSSKRLFEMETHHKNALDASRSPIYRGYSSFEVSRSSGSRRRRRYGFKGRFKAMKEL